MTLGEIATKARSLINASTTTYTDANLLIDINMWYQKAVTMILESQDESDFDDARNTNSFPIKTTPLVANQRDYSIPVSEKVLKIKRLDITYDGTNWYKAEPIDSNEIDVGVPSNASSTAEATLDAYFDKTAPRYDHKYNSLFIYPRPSATDVANGAKMKAEWSRQITPFVTADYTSVLTDSTIVPGFDDPFHPILAYGAAYEYATAKNLPQLKTIIPTLQDYEARIKQAYGNKQKDRRYQFSGEFIDYR